MKYFLIGFALFAFACSHKASTPENVAQAPVAPPAPKHQPPAIPAKNIKTVPQELLVQYLDQLVQEAKAEGHSVDMLMVKISSGEKLPSQFIKKLTELKKAQPNVKIRIFAGSSAESTKLQQVVKGKGIDIVNLNGKMKSNISLFRVGNKVLIGSSSLTQASMTPGKTNDMNILMDSSVITEKVQKYLAQLQSNPNQEYVMTESDGPITLLTDSAYFEKALSIISSSRPGSTLDIVISKFSLSSDKQAKTAQIYSALKMAQSRGVSIRLMLENRDSKIAHRIAREGFSKVYIDPKNKDSNSNAILYVGREPDGKFKKVALLGSSVWPEADFNNSHQLNVLVQDMGTIELISNYFNLKFAYEGQYQPPVIDGKQQEKMTRFTRFWQGYAQQNLTPEQFRDNINNHLIPATVAVGNERGQLVFNLAMLPSHKEPYLPDQIAFVSYTNEDVEKAVRSTPLGLKYGPFHYRDGLFTRQTDKGYRSNSTIVTPYSGKVTSNFDKGHAAEPVAYYTGSPDLNWESGFTLFRILIPSVSEPNAFVSAVEKNLDNLQKQAGYNGGQVSINSRYVLEISNFKDQRSANAAVANIEKEASPTLKTFHSSPFEIPQVKPGRVDINSALIVPISQITKASDELMNAVLQPMTPQVLSTDSTR